MNVGLLVLRVIVGALFAGHGTQKLFGWFGGHGPRGTASFFEQIGLRPGLPMALAAGASELTGGLLLGVGLAMPVAALLLAGVMATAIASVHWQNGIWSSSGGMEFPLVMMAVAFAVAAVGAGSLSLDDAFGIDWHGIYWAIGAVGIGTVGGVLLYEVARRLPVPAPTAEEAEQIRTAA